MDEDIDGIPFDKIDGNSMASGAFIPSKWETVDPEQVKDQAITTSKWDQLEPVAPDAPKIPALTSNYGDSDSDSNDNDPREYDEERRTKLRELELKVMEYADELECGKKSIKPGWSITQQVEHFRRKLLKKVDRQDSDSTSEKYTLSRRDRSLSPLDKKIKRSTRKSSSSPEYVKASRSPYTSERKKRRDSDSPIAKSK